MSSDIDIIALAAQAKPPGYDSSERIVQRLEQIIARNVAYEARRKARGTYTAFDQVVEEDNKALAACIVLLESMADKESEESL